jgi:hypothetical protein
MGAGSGLEALKAKTDMTLEPIELAPGKFLESRTEFLNPREGSFDESLREKIDLMRREGVGAVVAAEAFSVDDPSGEKRIMEASVSVGLPACGTHEMSGLYGLKVRTRTAVVNASILPKMMETALMTEKSLRSLEVQAPLMVMRSDGGVMSLEEVKRRPVMTLLSGPAAGIAAALMFLRAVDAVFLEVGGTSTDICLIRDGKASLRPAVLGGHPTYLRTLDSRTLGIAGGSLTGIRSAGKLDIGPRSAHLAGLRYASFASPEDLAPPLKVLELSPFPSDPPYLALENAAGERFGITTTCAANCLGYIGEGDYARGNMEALRLAFEALASHVGRPAEEVAREILDRMAEKIIPTVRQLLADYEMKDRAVKLVGGGGGASAVVPYVAEKLGLPFEIAPRAEIISAIGAALAMVRETVEKNILNPTQDDLARLRAEAERAVIRMGADPGSVQVAVEVDGQRKIVRATATGTVEFTAADILEQDVGEEARLRILRETAVKDAEHRFLDRTEFLHIYETGRIEKAFLNLLKKRKSTLWILDGRGGVKLQVPGGSLRRSRGAQLVADLERIITDHTSYDDAGARIPSLFVAAGKKIADLTALATREQVTALARDEFAGIGADEPVFFLIGPPS